MSQDTADFTGKTGAKVVFTFTPHPDGFAYLSGASLSEEDLIPQKYTPLDVANNTTEFDLPKDNSFIQLAIVDGPRPETGTVSYTVDDGASTVLWPDKPSRPLSSMQGAFYGFGN